MKTYSDFMDEILPEELYKGLLGFGLFSAKLPPVFSSESFYNYCVTAMPTNSDKWQPYVYYESIRNTNVPRQLGIPNPMTYQQLCKCISDHWAKIQVYFHKKTDSQRYIVSHIHIRKMAETNTLFNMNYENWKTDGSPEPDLLIGSKYLVRADISTCFPSIYTHSIPWALVGKIEAKSHAGKKWASEWYNQIDHFAQICKNGETHGLLIGPHASNLLGEIILSAVDEKLSQKWNYIRHIDDYTCFVKSREDAQLFLIDLASELREYDLVLNHKKTEISELPLAMTKQWTRQVGNPAGFYRKGRMDYIGARSYFDSAIEIMQNNKEDAAILNYAIKALPVASMTLNAIDYCVKTIMHLCLIYPYLLQNLSQDVFDRFCVNVDRIRVFSNMVYNQEIKNRNYDAICHVLYFALKYGFIIEALSAQDAIESDSCVFRLLAFLYFKKNMISSERAKLRDLATKLQIETGDFGRNWLFVYEALPQSELPIDWKELKNNNVSFLKKEFQY